MSTSSDGLPLSLRKKDIFFVACFSFFAFSSFFSDSWHALGLLEGDGFWPTANRWYGEVAKDYFMSDDAGKACAESAPDLPDIDAEKVYSHAEAAARRKGRKAR